MRKRAPIYTSILLLIVIIFIVLGIVQKTRVLGVSISRISKETVVSSPSGGFKYFYEPKPFSQGQKIPEYIPFKAKYTINSDSLNDRYEYLKQKEKGTYRIITLGDSFTYGVYVDTPDNWTERLEDLLNQSYKCSNIAKFEVINLGVYGYDNDYSVERFKVRGVKYNPDLVLWYQVVPTRMNELAIPLTKQYYQESSRSGKLQNQIDEGRYYESGIKARSKIIKDIGETRLLEHQKDTLLNLRNLFRGPLVLMVQPSLLTQEKKMIRNVVDAVDNWNYFDGLARYTEEEGYFKGDGHPNQKGHEIIANIMFNYLNGSNIISCNSSSK